MFVCLSFSFSASSEPHCSCFLALALSHTHALTSQLRLLGRLLLLRRLLGRLHHHNLPAHMLKPKRQRPLDADSDTRIKASDKLLCSDTRIKAKGTSGTTAADLGRGSRTWGGAETLASCSSIARRRFFCASVSWPSRTAKASRLNRRSRRLSSTLSLPQCSASPGISCNGTSGVDPYAPSQPPVSITLSLVGSITVRLSVVCGQAYSCPLPHDEGGESWRHTSRPHKLVHYIQNPYIRNSLGWADESSQ